MNDMTTALKAAGVPVPTRLERIWTLLKEKPGLDYKQVQRELNIPEGSASSALNDLVCRKMVRMTHQFLPGTKRKRAVYEALGRTYALLPRENSALRRKFVAAKQATLVTPASVVEPVKEWSAEETVDAMSIKQAKAVYEYLKGVFA